MSGTLYTFDLGFNWQSMPLGGAFDAATEFYPLELGIVDPDGSVPRWPTQLSYQDSVRFHITDITSGTNATPGFVHDTVIDEDGSLRPLRQVTSLAVAFTNPTEPAIAYPFSNQPEGIYRPVLGRSDLPGLLFEGGNIVFQDNRSQSAVYNAQNAGWRLARWYAGAEAGGTRFDFGVQQFVKTSFLVTATFTPPDQPESTETRQFLLDPEMFVGDQEY